MTKADIAAVVAEKEDDIYRLQCDLDELKIQLAVARDLLEDIKA